MEKELTIAEKEMCLRDINYPDHNKYKYKINAELLQINIQQESYREQLVSFFQMAPLMNKTVPLEDADYILYANPYARVAVFIDDVISDLEYIDANRKPNAEIIILGKACNIKNIIKDKYSNITYIPTHYADYIGKRFEINCKEEYVVYDERKSKLSIWPVDGCLNRCAFCRRTFMDIPFESQPLEYIKKRLDWIKKNHPEQLKFVSLRAENLTQYGIDIDGKEHLHELIDLLNSYDEIERIELPIGMCIGEITPEILKSLCHCKKITNISLNLEAGSDRLLTLVGKKHNREKAIEIFQTLRKYLPQIYIASTVMIGLPTEELIDIYELADLVQKCDINYLHCNYYGHYYLNALDIYPQLSQKLKEHHLSCLIKILKDNYNGTYVLEMRHQVIGDSSRGCGVRRCKNQAYNQQFALAKPTKIVYEYFFGSGISVKLKDEVPLSDIDFYKKEVKRILKARNNSLQDQMCKQKKYIK